MIKFLNPIFDSKRSCYYIASMQCNSPSPSCHQFMVFGRAAPRVYETCCVYVSLLNSSVRRSHASPLPTASVDNGFGLLLCRLKTNGDLLATHLVSVSFVFILFKITRCDYLFSELVSFFLYIYKIAVRCTILRIKDLNYLG